MKLSQFKFKLPEEKIALHPTKYRDESRLMVLHRKTGEIEHKEFKDVLNYFDDKDVFIFNDTKVFPARLYGGNIFLRMVLKLFNSFRSLTCTDNHHPRSQRIECAGMAYFQFLHFHPSADVITHMSHNLKRSPPQRFIKIEYFSFFKLHLLSLHL